MTDLQAAIGLGPAQRLPEMVARRRELAAAYTRAFADVPGLRCVADPDDGDVELPVVLGRGRPRLSRWTARGLLAHLAAARHLGSPRHHGGAPPAGVRRSRPRRRHCLVTERLTDNTLILPLYHQMTDVEQSRVVDVLREI